MTALPPEPFFSGPGLDRADAMRADAAGLRALAASAQARQLRWHNGLPVLKSNGRLAWAAAADPRLFLGLDGKIPCFSALQEVIADARSAFSQLALLNAVDAPLFAAAVSLARWHSQHRFCANCGQRSELVRGGWSRLCQTCSAEHYPRVDPVVIMLAVHGDQLLLGRQPQYAPSRYSALAGFVEVGENLEAAVARELFEEAGVRVRNIRYVASQPWPFPSSLMLGCIAEAQAAELRIDTTELEDASWFSREEVAAAIAGERGARFEPPPLAAIARTLIEHWLTA